MGAGAIWTIKSCLDWTRAYLEKKGDEHARLSAEWLLGAATKKSRTQLYMSYDEELSSSELERMHTLVERRAQGEPLQYITGTTTFRFIEVACEPKVLIPRPETELLVDIALEGVDAASGLECVRVLEIGSGTGCVSCAIATERPEVQVLATDISPHAATLTRKNIHAQGLEDRIGVIECDLASGVPERLYHSFAVLVSNPPYIPTDIMNTLPHEVKGFEPELALAGGTDGLDVFRRLLKEAPQMLVEGGMFAVELHEEALGAARDLAQEQGIWSSVEIREDLTHRPRFLVARLAGELPLKQQAQTVEARLVDCDQQTPDESVLKDAISTLASGGIVVVPTDSVYGLAAAATPNNPGHRRIFDIKKRDYSQTLPLLIADPEDLCRYACDVSTWAQKLADNLWPGALTLVVKASEAVSEEYRRPDGTVALRVPDSNLVRVLTREIGPLSTTSANTHGMPAPTTSDDIERRIADLCDLTLCAGPTPEGEASTIVDCTGPEPKIVRVGAISPETIYHIAAL